MAASDDKDDKDDRHDGAGEAGPKLDEAGPKLDEAAASDEAGAPRKRKRKKRPAGEAPRADAARLVAEPIAAPTSRRNKIIGAAVVVAALAAGGYLIVRSQIEPAWKVGDVVDVEITLVAGDGKNLACAALDEVEGRHCAFEAADKPWSKSPDQSDDKTLRPYTTVEKQQLAAAGLWGQPVMQGKLPNERFTVACKFKVEGKLVKPMVRWSSTGPFADAGPTWPAGMLSDCKIAGAPDAGP